MKKLIYAFMFFFLLLTSSCDTTTINEDVNKINDDPHIILEEVNGVENFIVSIEEVKQVSQKSSEIENFCNSDEAVDIFKSYYNTITSDAKFYVTIPKGHIITGQVNLKDNYVNLISNGVNTSNQIITYSIHLSGFKKGNNNSIFIELEIADNNVCTTFNNRLYSRGEKHKNGEVEGAP